MTRGGSAIERYRTAAFRCILQPRNVNDAPVFLIHKHISTYAQFMLPNVADRPPNGPGWGCGSFMNGSGSDGDDDFYRLHHARG